MAASSAPLRVLIGGGTGFLGQALRARLEKAGHSVRVISRSPSAHDDSIITWASIEHNGLPPCDAIVQLSGANIIEHAWTEQRKQELHDSRVKLSQLLVASIRASPDPPRVFIGISSTSIYPTTPEPNYIEWSESSPIPPESQLPNFAMSLCRSWEDTYNSLDHSISSSTTTTTSSASSACSCSCSCSCSMPSRSSMVRPATRLVIVRIPQVLSSKGRMLTHVKLAFQLGLGGTLGSGRQLFPWIHIDDWTSFVELAIKSEDIRGTFNLVAPEIADNAQFTAALASALWRPSFFFVPSFVVRLAYGERAPLLLEGAHIRSERLPDTGFTFAHPALHEATAHLFTNNV